VTDPRLERLFASLDASFDAALAREEDEAATDLAVSLRHDLPLADVVVRGSWTMRLAEGGRAGVVIAGRDFVGGDCNGALMVPTSRAVLQAASGPTPRASDFSLLELLRVMGRQAAEVQLDHPAAPLEGRLLVAGSGYLVLDTTTGRSLIGLESIAAIRVRNVRWADVL
jgi:hypothetical protein